MAACRHRQSWIVAGGCYEWCYQCGAFRRLAEITPTLVEATSPWCKPTGPDGDNPWESWRKRTDAYRKRRARMPLPPAEGAPNETGDLK